MKIRASILLGLILTLSMTQVFASANHEEQSTSPEDSFSVYLPLVARQQDVDLTIARLEVSQAIQTQEQSVPLVTNRSTIVRAYLQAIGTGPVNGVYVSFSASRDGVALPESPLIIGPRMAPSEPSRDSYTSTINVSLPNTWLSGTISLTVTADSAGIIPETNEENNMQTATLSFRDVPPLSLRIVPINYTEGPTGIYFPAVFTDNISNFVMATYPLSSVNVTFRTAVSFTGDLSVDDEWDRLLSYITAIKNSDGAPRSQVYYGLVPLTNANGDWIDTAWGGMAWIGMRVGVGIDGLDEFDTTGAHEIGHMFGRGHAPCGGPSGVDPNYPYPNASIGNYGIDVLKGMLISPGAPDNAKDLMSYCYPKWVSDYTYVALYNDQRAHGAGAVQITSAPVMLIRITFNNSGIPTFLPVYSLMGVPDEREIDSDYAVELLGATGTVMETYPVKLLEAGERGERFFSIHALILRPTQQISTLRLTHLGKVIAERHLSDHNSFQATAQVFDPLAQKLTLHWGDADVPTLVRFSTSNSETWTTLDLDILGGSFQVDPSLIAAGTYRVEIIPADASIPTHKILFFVNNGEK